MRKVLDWFKGAGQALRAFVKRFFGWILILACALAGFSLVGAIVFYFFWMQIFSWGIWTHVLGLPDFSTFKDYHPYQTAYFLSRDGEVIGCLAEEWRDIISPESIKQDKLSIAEVVLAVEDRRFYQRDLVIDVRSMARALFEDVKASVRAKKIKIVEGGSTIPQQLVKQLLPAEERQKRHLTRKFKELVLASRLVQTFTKDEILTFYLNEVYLGHNRFGVEAASQFYFDKKVDMLSLSEAAVIAGLIHSPEYLSPKKHPDAAKLARNTALAKIYQDEKISEEDYQKSIKEEIVISDAFVKSCARAPHAVWEARKIMLKDYGLFFAKDKLQPKVAVEDNNEETPSFAEDQSDLGGKNYARLGLRVQTTIDLALQNYAQQGVKLALEAYKERQKENAIYAEGAFLAIENGTGAIIAMVGGSDFSKSQFNHATQARRLTGSAFKPVVYAARFEEELAQGTPYDRLLDRQVSNARIRCRNQFDHVTKQWTYWEPRNFDEKKFAAGSYTRRFAIAQSINRPAVWTAQVGRCKLDPRVLTMAKRLGIESTIDPYLPSALGASGISLMELARAYSVFANQGIKRENYLIYKIDDALGNVIFEKTIWKNERVINDVLAGVMVEALRGVVKFGTARSMNDAEFLQPVAGKTGTTEGYIDAWFMGFTPDIAFGAWVGGPKDYKSSLGEKETGGKTALPIAKYALKNWYQGYEPVEFSEESPEYMKSLVSPSSFDEEMKSLEDGDPDVEAPQE